MNPALRYAYQIGRRDGPNLVRYGRSAPQWAQRIWVHPDAVRQCVMGYGNDRSGEVAAGWNTRAGDVRSLPKVRAAIAHWSEGVPWEDTGVFAHLLGLIRAEGEYDGCRTRAELMRRYERIDAVYEQVRRDGRLLTQRELRGRRAFRELGGVRAHIGAEGEAIFGGAGQHRLAMAIVLRLPTIPAQVGLVHADAIADGHWGVVRSRR